MRETETVVPSSLNAVCADTLSESNGEQHLSNPRPVGGLSGMEVYVDDEDKGVVPHEVSLYDATHSERADLDDFFYTLLGAPCAGRYVLLIDLY